MKRKPKTIDINSLAYDALQIIEKNNITQIIVMDHDVYVGILHLHEILKEGII